MRISVSVATKQNRIHPGRVGQDGNGVRGPGDGGVTFRKISIEKEPG